MRISIWKNYRSALILPLHNEKGFKAEKQKGFKKENATAFCKWPRPKKVPIGKPKSADEPRNYHRRVIVGDEDDARKGLSLSLTGRF